MPHARRRQQLQHSGEHAQSRPQHRYHDNVTRYTAPFGLFERRLYDRALGRQISQRFGHEQDADAVGDLAKDFRFGLDVAKLTERVVNQRMHDEVDRHAGHYIPGLPSHSAKRDGGD